MVAKANEIGIIPKFASPTLLVLKNSVKDLGKEQYKKLPISKKLKYNRLVLCQNKLNDYVEKIPHLYTTVEDTIKAVGEAEYIITSDLTDSFWQRHIKDDKKPYFAFHSPFRGNYICENAFEGDPAITARSWIVMILTYFAQYCIWSTKNILIFLMDHSL